MASSHGTVPPFPIQDGTEFRLLPFDNRYCVSNDGRIFSRARRGNPGSLLEAWHELKQYAGTGGYQRVCIANKVHKVHRLVLLAFCGPPTLGSDVRHLDGSRNNNRVDNLAWGTPLQNSADCIAHGRSRRGEKHPFAKLTNAQSQMIRELRRRHPGRSGIGRFLSRWFDLSPTGVSRICVDRHYKSEIGISRRVALRA